jgi:outer membrane protein OmpA-like peptidoglycan-associated protein
MVALACPAGAQVATSSGSRVVLDPDTWQARVVNPTLDGRSAPDTPIYQPMTAQEPIILRKPRRHKPKPVAVAEAPPPAETPAAEAPPAEAPAETTPAPQTANAQPSLGAEDYDSGFGPSAPEPAPAPKPEPKKVAAKPKPAPAPKPEPAPKADSAIPFSFGGHDNYAAPAGKAQQQANIAPTPSSAPRASGLGGKVRNVHINFPPGAAEPSADVASALQTLAPDLTNELQSKSGRLLLQAFAGTPGDKSSEARRLSLKRALSVRQLLIDSGVPSDRIDVRAMGGITDGGKPDRVDVLLRG